MMGEVFRGPLLVIASEAKQSRKLVGWVKRSDTHQSWFAKVMGFAKSSTPSYALQNTGTGEFLDGPGRAEDRQEFQTRPKHPQIE